MRTKRMIFITLSVLLMLGLLGFVTGSDRYRLDGIRGVLGAAVLGDDTQHSPRYSDSSFAAVQPGTRAEDVVRKLGKPLREVANADGTHDWVYTATSGGNYRVRIIKLRGGVVVAKRHRFYLD